MADPSDVDKDEPSPEKPLPSDAHHVEIQSTDEDETHKHDRDHRLVDETDASQSKQSYAENLDTEDPWSRTNLLTLDGGGIRGYSSLLMLKTLMEYIRFEEKSTKPYAYSSTSSAMIEDNHPKAEMAKFPTATKSRQTYLPCHYFDYIAGTSTGGLIAIMLGRLRMSVDDCLMEYKQLYNTVLGRHSSSRMSIIMGHKRWNTHVQRDLEKWAKKLQPAQSSPDEKSDKLSSDPARCRTIICSIDKGPKSGFLEPRLYRSYPHGDPHGGSLRKNKDTRDQYINLWEVARATTAATAFWKSAKINSALNNPSYQVLKEVDAMNKHTDTSIGLFLSIGCGRSTEPRANEIARERLSLMQHTYQVSEAVHKLMVLEHSGFEYQRLDAKNELNRVDIGEWKEKGASHVEQVRDLEHLQEATERYLNNAKIREKLRQVARRLVSIRRRRAETMRWERFALGTRYRCSLEPSMPECAKTIFETRNEYMDHLRKCHNAESPGANNYEIIKSVLDRGRIDSDSSGTSSTDSKPALEASNASKLAPSPVSSPNMSIFASRSTSEKVGPVLNY